jgi:AraC-like DNA-binding protein
LRIDIQFVTDTIQKMTSPLADFPLVRTVDVEVAESFLSRNLEDSLRILQAPERANFDFEMNGVSLGQTALLFNKFESPVSIEVDEVDQPLLLALGRGTSSRVQLEGRVINTRETWSVCTPGKKVRIERAAGSGILMVKVSFSLLQRRLECILGESLHKTLVLAPTCSARGDHGAHLQELLSFLARELARDPGLLNLSFWRHSYDEMLLNLLVGLKSNYTGLLNKEAVSVPKRLVQRAEDYMEAHCAEPIRISDLLLECGCPRRELFRAFERYRDYSPRQFLERVRLSRVHHDLTSNRASSVTQVALRWGFTHLGRFSKLYRARYGQSPSDVLRKSEGKD